MMPQDLETTRLATAEAEVVALRAENARLRGLLGLDERSADAGDIWTPTLFGREVRQRLSEVDRHSPRSAKLALFRQLFGGREDVFALRWENGRTGKAGWGPAVVGGWANARKAHREYLHLNDEMLENHLEGDVHVGVYPLLRGDLCRFLACDFDGPGWVLDALAYYDAARAAGIPAALERSRSGDGAHVWTFFAEAVPASAARRVGIHLLREAMTVRAELDLVSYDRLFPAQDFMPKGSFGNLIALPLLVRSWGSLIRCFSEGWAWAPILSWWRRCRMRAGLASRAVPGAARPRWRIWPRRSGS
jgi:hypothetical protein